VSTTEPMTKATMVTMERTTVASQFRPSGHVPSVRETTPM